MDVCVCNFASVKQGPRAQCDRDLYRNAMQNELIYHTPNLSILKGSAEDLHIQDKHVAGLLLGMSVSSVSVCVCECSVSRLRSVVRLCRPADGRTVKTRHVVLTTGTFLRAMIHIGPHIHIPAGRMGDGPANGLSLTLEKYGFALSRLTTSTPPRLDGRTISACLAFSFRPLLTQQTYDITHKSMLLKLLFLLSFLMVWITFADYNGLEEQKTECPATPFSYMFDAIPNIDKQISCFSTYTNEKTHKVIRDNMALLPTFKGNGGKGQGPRYCVSIEGKIRRFASKERHQV
jgi:tRNA uridine 5-carboxymethylaminomethyl modification enzyme